MSQGEAGRGGAQFRGTPQQLEANTDKEVVQASRRAEGRIMGRQRTPQRSEGGEPLSDLDVPVTDEQVDAEIDRILRLNETVPNPVTRKAAQKLREAVESRPADGMS